MIRKLFIYVLFIFLAIGLFISCPPAETTDPTQEPTDAPTDAPTVEPTIAPTTVPTAVVTAVPTPAGPPAELYVSKTGSDTTGNGTKDNPYASIQRAVDESGAGTVIKVSVGIYSESVTVIAGNTLEGSYNADFSGRSYITEADREDVLYKTEIQDPATSGGIYFTPNAAIICDTVVFSNTTIEGFVITGGAQAGNGYSSGILCKNGADLIIVNNTISGGGGDYSFAVYCYECCPTISSNVVYGTGHSGTSFTHGLHNYGSAPNINNNLVIVAAGTSETIGIYNYSLGASPNIINNTVIVESDSNNIVGCWNYTDSDPTIMNNIISVSTSLAFTGIYGIRDSATPEVTNNCIYVTGSDDDGTDYSGTDGNVAVDPVLDVDYKLSGSSPITVTEGGLTTGIVTIDIEGTDRTAPYSMGAFELDLE